LNLAPDIAAHRLGGVKNQKHLGRIWHANTRPHPERKNRQAVCAQIAARLFAIYQEACLLYIPSHKAQPVRNDRARVWKVDGEFNAKVGINDFLG
jgi:hypothetical protein